MKKIVLLIVALAVIVSAQMPGESTIGFVNGRFWLRMSRPEKLAWLIGFDEGVAIGKAEQNYFPKDSTAGEAERSLDLFYAKPEYAQFPLQYALEIFVMRANGASQSDIDARILGRVKLIQRVENMQ